MLRRKNPTRALGGLAGLIATIGISLAAPDTEAQPEEVPTPLVSTSPRRPGTHFIVELSGGVLTTREPGPTFSALLGAGGKPPGVPLRFYAITELTYGETSASNLDAFPPHAVRDRRSYLDLTGGLRAYLPLFAPVRLFADALVGASRISAEVDMADSQRPSGPSERGPFAETLATSGWKPLVAVGGGLQIRFIRHLALGLRGRVVLTGDDVGHLRQLTGQKSSLRTSVSAGLTCHF